MNQNSTIRLSASDGSTSPNFQPDDYAVEAAKIAARWRRSDAARLAERFQNKDLLRRHKSLVLNLVIEDCQKVKDSKSSQERPLDLASRFQGLGDSLEQSIYRQLEVQQYLDEHPELLQQESCFSWPELGDRFRDFEVIDELGRGALARVYQCRQESLAGRLVVVKLCFGIEPLEPSLLGQLQHPNIVPVHYAEELPESGASLICMPFLGRSTLADLITLSNEYEHPKPVDLVQKAANLWLKPSERLLLGAPKASQGDRSHINQVLGIAVSVARALQFAHTKGVLHGDIKPTNILLTSAGHPLLFDFNLGRELTQLTGPVGGTIPYMAPELLDAIASPNTSAMTKPTIATEIYSFGVLLHELVYGSTFIRPDAGEAPSMAAEKALSSIRNRDVIVKSNSLLNSSLRSLIDRCLSLEPQDRPASMQEVVDSLKRELGKQRSLARSIRTHKKKYAIGVTVLLFGIVSLVALWVRLPPYSVRMYHKAFKAQEAGDLERSLSTLKLALSIDPNYHDALLLRARGNLLNGNLLAAREDMEKLVEQENLTAVRPFIGYYFDLNQKYAQAIPWYEATIQEQGPTAEILNNLGMSLFLAQKSSLDPESRLTQAHKHLCSAIDLDQEAELYRRNAARIEMELLNQQIVAAERISRENIEWLCQRLPDDPEVNLIAFHLYTDWSRTDPSLAEIAIERLEKAHTSGIAPTAKALEMASRYSVLRDLDRFQELVQRVKKQGQAARAKSGPIVKPFLAPPLDGLRLASY